jgi:2-oxo-4-hydroxy-4-carboxy-5-ureidoimidazoline decarboxylase
MRPSRQALGTLLEGAPRFVERLLAEEVADWDELFDRAEAIAHQMPEDEQVELLDAHPRIGALPSTVSALSYREQGYNRDRDPDELRARLERLNDAYEARFGFRFVVFVNGRPRGMIADVLEDRLRADRAEELTRGLSDVIAVARDRRRRMEAA